MTIELKGEKSSRGKGKRQELSETIPALARLEAAKETVKQGIRIRDEEAPVEPVQTPPVATPPAPIADGPMATVDDPVQTPDTNNPSLTDPKAQPEDGDKWKKRYDDSRTFINDLQSTINTLQDEVKALKKKPVELPVKKEEVEKWVKDNKEIADIITSMQRLESAELLEEVKQAKDELENIKRATSNAQLFQEVLKVHPDADTIRRDPKFHDWFKLQTKAVKSLIESTVAADVVRGVQLYKDDTGVTKVRVDSAKSEDAAAAVTIKGSSVPPAGPKVWKASEVNKMNETQYAKYRTEIKQAMKEGRYDPLN